jgi:hypothetical protein
MQSEEGRFDPATVTGIKSSDQVLVVGNPAFLPWLTSMFGEQPHTGNLITARKPGNLDALLKNGSRFDKLVLTRETAYTHEHALYAGAFRAQLVAFPKNEGEAFHIEQSIEFYYPGVRVVRLDSTFGPVVIASPVGASWRVIHA